MTQRKRKLGYKKFCVDGRKIQDLVNIRVDVREVAIIRWEMQPLLIAFTPDLNWFLWRFSERLEPPYREFSCLLSGEEIASCWINNTACTKWSTNFSHLTWLGQVGKDQGRRPCAAFLVANMLLELYLAWSVMDAGVWWVRLWTSQGHIDDWSSIRNSLRQGQIIRDQASSRLEIGWKQTGNPGNSVDQASKSNSGDEKRKMNTKRRNVTVQSLQNKDNVDEEKGHMSAYTMISQTTKFSEQRWTISICYNLLIGVFEQNHFI